MSNYHGHNFELDTRNNSWSHLYSYINDKSRILDVGCANGNFGAALINLKKCEVVGLDIDKDDIKIAKKQLTEAHLFDIDKDNINKLGKFDYIIFADVIEHLINPRSTLNRISGLLKEDGRILFSIPNMAHISVRLDLLEGSFPYRNRGLLDNTHIHFYDYNEVESVFEDAGYQIQKMDPVVSSFTDTMLRRRLEGIGLRYDKTFINMLNTTKADIFQFVGSAALLQQSKKNTHKNLEYIMPQDILRQQTEQIEKKLAQSAKEYEEKEVQLRRELNNIPRRRLLKKLINKSHKIA